jgi:hypothetical protein
VPVSLLKRVCTAADRCRRRSGREIFMTHQGFKRNLLFFTMLGALAAGPSITETAAATPATSRTHETAAPRVNLDLQPAQQETLKATMREHLAALQAIVSALATGDFDKAAALTHTELGFPKHHEAMQRERGMALPKHYQELAMAHHQAAEELATAITARKMTPILQHLGRTIRACNACHNAYQLSGP